MAKDEKDRVQADAEARAQGDDPASTQPDAPAPAKSSTTDTAATKISGEAEVYQESPGVWKVKADRPVVTEEERTVAQPAAAVPVVATMPEPKTEVVTVEGPTELGPFPTANRAERAAVEAFGETHNITVVDTTDKPALV